jgi:hypothetical protein
MRNSVKNTPAGTAKQPRNAVMATGRPKNRWQDPCQDRCSWEERYAMSHRSWRRGPGRWAHLPGAGWYWLNPYMGRCSVVSPLAADLRSPQMHEPSADLPGKDEARHGNERAGALTLESVTRRHRRGRA